MRPSQIQRSIPSRRRRLQNRPQLEQLEVRVLSTSSPSPMNTQTSPQVVFGTSTPAAGAVGGVTRQIASSGTTSIQASVAGSDTVQWPEFPGTMDRGDTSGSGDASGSPIGGVSVNSGQKAKSNSELVTSFDGLTHRDQQLANGGNQFSLEPPDQGLAVGNGYVLEVVNDVMRAYDTSGNALSGVQDLNTFLGYAAQIDRSTGVYGPSVTDPSAYFDPDTRRWFVSVLTFDTLPDGTFTGRDHIDLAVSQTADPTGAWNIYRLPVQDDGTDGTPNHGPGGPWFGDYPHIGADKYGFYITTNEYAFSSLSGRLEDEVYHAAQIYALSKNALASGAPSVAVTQFDTIGMVHSSRLGIQPGFTVWPATSPGSQYADDQGGTEYFMSSNAAEEVNDHSYVQSTDLIVWALTNTRSLDTATPALSLTNKVLTVGQYSFPPPSEQKAGDFPLGQALNDPNYSTILIGGPDPYAPEVESHLDSNDTRMQQVVYAYGMLWGALDTAVIVGGVEKAGIEWFIINPNAGWSSSIVNQGYLALANNNLTYPALAVTPCGRGVMGFTVVGNDYYPSAGYASIDARVGVGDIHIAAAGLGPEDGYTGYKAVGDSQENTRSRWGDYGAAVADGNNIWLGTEYIGQTGTLAQYVSEPFGSVGGTRTALANWYTRISQLTT